MAKCEFTLPKEFEGIKMMKMNYCVVKVIKTSA